LINITDEFDIKEKVPIADAEFMEKRLDKDRLAKVMRAEETKWFQHAEVKDILECDNNMRYINLVASGNHCKKLIQSDAWRVHSFC
jgi:hypothetical protein